MTRAHKALIRAIKKAKRELTAKVAAVSLPIVKWMQQ